MNQEEIENIITEFGDLIIAHHITEKIVKGGKTHIDMRLVFKNGSKMKAFFVFIKTKIQYGYSFHWMQTIH